VLADEGVLNFGGAFGLDLTLARNEVVLFGLVVAMAGGRSTVRPRGERRSSGQERSQNNDLRGSKENHATGTSVGNNSAIYRSG
jgi:hypothetical protein